MIATAQPRQHFLQGLGPHGFHRLAYLEWGDAANPRVVICVHGLTRNSRDFDFLAQALAADYRVICPDVAGRGQSEWLKHAQDYAYPQYCADMNALIARLGVAQVDWVGTSMGGLIGMMLAAQPNSPLRKLILNDVGAFIPKAALERIAMYVGKAPAFPDLRALEAYLRAALSGFGQLSAAQWAHIAQYSAVKQEDGALRLHYDPSIASAFSGVLADVELWPLWQAVQCPSLILRGAQSDLLLQSTVERMLAIKPGTRAAEIADVGHAPALMDAEQIGLVHSFLTS